MPEPKVSAAETIKRTAERVDTMQEQVDGLLDAVERLWAHIETVERRLNEAFPYTS